MIMTAGSKLQVLGNVFCLVFFFSSGTAEVSGLSRLVGISESSSRINLIYKSILSQ